MRQEAIMVLQACSAAVAVLMKHWRQMQAPGITRFLAPGGCYLVLSYAVHAPNAQNTLCLFVIQPGRCLCSHALNPGPIQDALCHW